MYKRPRFLRCSSVFWSRGVSASSECTPHALSAAFGAELVVGIASFAGLWSVFGAFAAGALSLKSQEEGALLILCGVAGPPGPGQSRSPCPRGRAKSIESSWRAWEPGRSCEAAPQVPPGDFGVECRRALRRRSPLRSSTKPSHTWTVSFYKGGGTHSARIYLNEGLAVLAQMKVPKTDHRLKPFLTVYHSFIARPKNLHT